jgi:hypothetical protein
MRDIRRYWREVRDLEATLPEFVWLVDMEGSVPVEVPAGLGAQLLIGKSHRAASDEELGLQREKELAAGKELKRERRRREGVAVITPPG